MPGPAKDIVESELNSIESIIANDRKGVGFSKCHLRKNIPTLLDGPKIPPDTLRALLRPNATWLSGFGYQGVVGIVHQSFGVRLLSSIELFGIESSGQVNSICFAKTQGNNASEADIKNMVGFAAQWDLLLVDWCLATVIRPSFSDYMRYFTRG